MSNKTYKLQTAKNINGLTDHISWWWPFTRFKHLCTVYRHFENDHI